MHNNNDRKYNKKDAKVIFNYGNQYDQLQQENNYREYKLANLTNFDNLDSVRMRVNFDNQVDIISNYNKQNYHIPIYLNTKYHEFYPQEINHRVSKINRQIVLHQNLGNIVRQLNFDTHPFLHTNNHFQDGFINQAYFTKHTGFGDYNRYNT